jgi:hypothetical protein
MDAIGDCTMEAPPDSFEPEVQWSWPGRPASADRSVTPLVANLTDDNGDGAIDLCDIPDIVVTGHRDRSPNFGGAHLRARRRDRHPALPDPDQVGWRSPRRSATSTTTASRRSSPPRRSGFGGPRARSPSSTTAP